MNLKKYLEKIGKYIKPYKTSNFYKGFKSAFDISGLYSSLPEEIDEDHYLKQANLSLKKDWENVGNYIRTSIEKYGKSMSDKL